MQLPTESTERLAYLRTLYAMAVARHPSDRYAAWLAQYKGSALLDGTSVPAETVRNITYELIEAQISTDIPHPVVKPATWSEVRERNAKAVERLCSGIRDRLPFEAYNDLCERRTYIYGGSVWLAEWDAARGEAVVHNLAPDAFVGQPDIAELSQMEYCFLRFLYTKEELMRTFGASEKLAEDCACGGDTAEVIVCWYRDTAGRVSRYIFGEGGTLADDPDYYARRGTSCEVLTTDVVTSAGNTIPAGTILPYYRPQGFPIVIRRNTSQDGNLLGQSDCAFIRPQQQAINKVESRILQKLMRSGVYPVVPEGATLSTLSSDILEQVISLRRDQSMAQFGILDTQPHIADDVSHSDRLYDQAKRILGMSDTYLGMDENVDLSGVSRQLQVDRSAGRLASKRKMKDAAYAALDRILFELHLAFADAPRALAWKDASGRVHNSVFSRYDFLEADANGNYHYVDDYLFSAEAAADNGYERTTLWREIRKNFADGAFGPREADETLLVFWQNMERAHYPYARENVERLSEKLKKHKEDKQDASR